MNIISVLPPPLNGIEIEKAKGDYKDFGLSPQDPYPLKGVTYPVDYGFLPGYIGEDGDELDFFVGSDAAGRYGYIEVWRPDVPKEHKYYVGTTDTEVEAILEAFRPVLLGNSALSEIAELIESIEPFRKQSSAFA